jgi:N-acetylglucosamine-6-phosphate deacetylase
MSRGVEPDRFIEGALVHGPRIVAGRLTVRGGRIVDVDLGARAGALQTSTAPVRPGDRIPAPWVVAPGFIDVHIHGSGGASAMDGSPALEQLAGVLAGHGVTSFLPTAVTAPLADLAGFAADVRAARSAQAARKPGALAGARILGANLEGPAIDPAHRGAHDPASIVDPAVLLAAWQADPRPWTEVRIVTLAPERPGGLDLVRYLITKGVIASIGHTGATFEEACAAYAAGARSTTHLFNRMTGLEGRAPGVVGAALIDRRASAELIADAVHVDPTIWPVLWRVLGPRLVLVSDATVAAGLGDGTYRLGGIAVTVANGRATTADGRLAGSTISVADAVSNLVSNGLALPRAVGAATIAPATLLGRPDLGRLKVGAWADLVVLDPAGRVQRTMIGGRWLD